MLSEEAMRLQIEGNRAQQAALQRLRAASLSREAAFSVAGSCLPQGGAVRLDYPAGDGALAQLSFPASAEDAAFQALAANSKPASFGKGTETVLDPGYRRALTLDPDAFLTSFSVAEHGLLSQVQRLMMPGAETVSATLLHFNIYQEGGFFKSHVDTPGGADMFGSLVVCLPVQHTGGTLRISHGGRTVLHDWGPKSSNTIQWAAFYSDCEHEVLPVESGARVTLTYSLHAKPYRTGVQAPAASPLVPALHAALEDALADANFMPRGGVLGFPCQHAYPHATSDAEARGLEGLLKGPDAAVVATLRALRLPYKVTRVLDTKGQYYSMDDEGDGDEELVPAAFRPVSIGTEMLEEDQVDSWFVRQMGVLSQTVTWLLPEEDSGRKSAFGDWQLAGTAIIFGNDSADTMKFYCACGILVTIDPYDKRAGAGAPRG